MKYRNLTSLPPFTHLLLELWFPSLPVAVGVSGLAALLFPYRIEERKREPGKLTSVAPGTSQTLGGLAASSAFQGLLTFDTEFPGFQSYLGRGMGTGTSTFSFWKWKFSALLLKCVRIIILIS